MRSRTSHSPRAVALLTFAILGSWSMDASRTAAQEGEVLEEGEAGEDEATADDEHEASADRSELDAYDGGPPTPQVYVVGSDLGIEVGGHLIMSIFTLPSLPDLDPGFGFQGRIATDLVAGIVGEANLGLVFNPGSGSGQGTYKNAFLRVGGRYPIDLQSDPVHLFLGAGAALSFFAVTEVDVATGSDRTRSAVTPAFDVQLGLMYTLTDRIALEAIISGNYAFPTVVFLSKAASWFALFGGLSYDI